MSLGAKVGHRGDSGTAEFEGGSLGGTSFGLIGGSNPTVSIREELTDVLRDGRALPGMATWNRLGSAFEQVLSGEEEFRPVYEAFPRLMLRIFGFAEDGWLEEACAVESKERDALLRVLLPNGPLHCLACAIAPEYTFEFPLSNLPAVTQRATEDIFAQVHSSAAAGTTTFHAAADDEDITESTRSQRSLLGWFCAARLVPGSGRHLVLTCYEYFLMCMLTSPLWRGRSRALGFEARKRKRSSQLPSRRAMYNQLYQSYVSFFVPGENSSDEPAAYGELFLRASLELFTETGDLGQNLPAASTLDALTVLALHVKPTSPRDVSFLVCPQTRLFEEMAQPPPADPQCSGMVSLAAARKAVISKLRIFAAEVGPMWTTTSSVAMVSLVALMRSVALHLAPWSLRLNAFAEDRTLPRKKRRRSVAASALERLPTRLSSSLQDDRTGSSLVRATNEADFKGWEEYLKRLDLELTLLLPRFVDRAAKLSLGSADDGAQLILSLSDAFAPRAASAAVAAARSSLAGPWYSFDQVGTLRELQRQINSTVRFGPGGRNTGAKTDLRGLAAVVGAADIAPGSSGGGGAFRKREGKDKQSAAEAAIERIRRTIEPDDDELERMRQQVALGQRRCFNRDVKFLGGVWDLPPYSYEFAPLLPVLYTISMAISRRIHREVNLRFLATYHALFGLSCLISLLYIIMSSTGGKH